MSARGYEELFDISVYLLRAVLVEATAMEALCGMDGAGGP